MAFRSRFDGSRGVLAPVMLRNAMFGMVHISQWTSHVTADQQNDMYRSNDWCYNRLSVVVCWGRITHLWREKQRT
jgi:hypothetical protein